MFQAKKELQLFFLSNKRSDLIIIHKELVSGSNKNIHMLIQKHKYLSQSTKSKS